MVESGRQPTKLEGWKWRKAIVAVSGPAVSAAVGLAAVLVGLTSDYPVHIRVAIGLFGSLNLIELVNLIPSGKRATDGGNLLLALQCSPEKARDFALAALCHEIGQLLDRKNTDATERAKAFFAFAPERPEGSLMLGLALTQAGEFDDAHRHLKDGLALLPQSDLSAEQIAQIRSEVSLAIAECKAAAVCD